MRPEWQREACRVKPRDRQRTRVQWPWEGAEGHRWRSPAGKAAKAAGARSASCAGTCAGPRSCGREDGLSCSLPLQGLREGMARLAGVCQRPWLCWGARRVGTGGTQVSSAPQQGGGAQCSGPRGRRRLGLCAGDVGRQSGFRGRAAGAAPCLSEKKRL